VSPTAGEIGSRSHDTEALYREHGASVARLCRSLLRDRAEAEDATQQVFLAVHRALLNGAAPREPLAWLLTVARNECYARFRQRALTPIPAPDPQEGATPDASVHALRAGELARMWDEVGRMPAAQREAFLLREIRGLSYGQLANELSLSAPSVRSLLLRARTRLRQRLGDVAAGLGGAPWIQALLRLAAGGDGASPLPAAAKAATVGVGALALVGGGGLVARHASRRPAQPVARHQTHARVRDVAAPAPVAVPSSGLDRQSSRLERSRGRDLGARRPRSSESGFRDGGGRDDTSTGDGSSASGREGSSDGTAVAQPTTKGHDGGGTSSGSGTSDGTSTSTSGSSSGSDGGSGSDDGSSSTTSINTTTTSSGSDGSGSDGSGGGSTDGGLLDGHGG
jgi:RNA polymerase sigma-70 factor (ECF subfamily)